MEKICIRLLAVCSLILGTLLVPPTAQAAVTSTRPSPHVLDGVGRGQVFTYDTTTDDGRPIQASATLYEPKAPWRGKGERPTIIFAPGTRGAGDQCAPSRAGMGLGSVGLSKVGSPTINANYEYGFYMGALHHGAQGLLQGEHALLGPRRTGGEQQGEKGQKGSHHSYLRASMGSSWLALRAG